MGSIKHHDLYRSAPVSIWDYVVIAAVIAYFVL